MMAPLLLVLLAALPVFAGPGEKGLVQFRDYEDRIIGGVPATIDEFPFIVVLLYLEKNRSIKHDCGGTIITKDWVLTAFHCTYPEDQPINIRAGSSFTDRRGILRGVMETASYGNQSHDIALIKVDKPWPLNGVTISLARLPRQDDPIPVGSPATIMGWGRVDEEGSSPEILMKQEVVIISSIFCNASWWHWNKRKIDEKKMCTLFKPPKNPSLASHSDSGSPVEVNGEVVGVVSMGLPCYTMVPTVHTRVSSYIDWIEENVGPLPSTK